MMKRKHKQAVRLAVWTGAGVVAIWLAVTAVSGLYFGTASECGGCHAMESYTRAVARGPHSALPCRSCHVTPGVAGIAAIGISGERRMLSAAFGGEPSEYSPVSDAACRRCHIETLARTVESHAIRVRHREFTSIRCSQCHAGSAHEIAGRAYTTSHMDECVGCHRPRASDPTTCKLCHVDEVERDKRGNTAWRAIHGPNWQRTHGMGQLATCSTCHESSVCERCHGTRIPHELEWMQNHGAQAAEADKAVMCTRCHEQSWCSNCHGLEMPHPAGFTKRHAPVAEKLGSPKCQRCHPATACRDCHARSRHPQGPADVDSPHEPTVEVGE